MKIFSAPVFGRLNTRGAATGGRAPDVISLRDHVLHAEIGAFGAERGQTQRLRVSVVAEVEGGFPPPGTDDVDAILSYDVLTNAVDGALAAARHDLLETLAADIAARVLGADRRAARVHVRVEKLDRADGALGVELTRNQSGDIVAAGAQDSGGRLLVADRSCLAPGVLSAALDALVASQGPVILCPPAHGDIMAVGDPVTDTRLALLALDQQAWRLAAQDPRCVIADSRTELDWGLQHGQVSVWAPARLVAAATTDGPSDLVPETLALWLAGRLGLSVAPLGGADDGR